MSKRIYQHITAVIYDRRGRILSIGQNSYDKSHPTQAKFANMAGEPYKIYMHAEIAALVKCRKKPFKIRVERKDKDGNDKLAKPCPICKLAIEKSGIKIVEYTVHNPNSENRKRVEHT